MEAPPDVHKPVQAVVDAPTDTVPAVSVPPRNPFRRWLQVLYRSLAEARALQAGRDPSFDRYLARAVAACRVARMAVPSEYLAREEAVAVSLALYRTAAEWALMALLDRRISQVGAALAELNAEILTEVMRDAAQPEQATRLFTGEPPTEPGALRTDYRKLRSATERLVRYAYRKRKHRQWLLQLYGARWALVGIAVLGLGSLVLAPPGTVWSPKNIAAGAAWRASSAESPYGTPAGKLPVFARASFFFHTEEQDSPWLEIELTGGTVSGAKVVNRPDCCQPRAIPLVIELSRDHQSWNEVAHRSKRFSTWNVRFARQPARWLRIRVPRRSILHLAMVEVYQ